MPRLNKLGQALMGVGDGYPSLDTALLGNVVGGAVQWLDTSTPIAQVILNGEYCLAQWNGTTWEKIADEGVNSIDAGGGRWAAAFSSGLRANFSFAPGSVMSLCGTDGRGAASRDGAIALCSTPECNSVDVYWPDGVVERISAVAYGLEIIGRGQYIWNGGQQGYDCKTAVPMTGRRVVQFSDEDWIVGWAEGLGLVAQLNGAFDGYILESRPVAFNHDAVRVGSELVVAWSVTQGEGPNDLIKVAVDRTRPRVPLAPNPSAVQPTFSLTHPCMVVPFKDPRQQAGTEYRMEDGSLGVYTEAEDPTDIIASAGRTRVLLGHDKPTLWVPPSALRPYDIPFIELYRLKSESLQNSVDRWRQQVLVLLAEWKWDCGVIPQFYCQGGAPPNELWTVQEVLNGLRYLSEIVNLSTRIKIIAPFAYERANGITGHSELAVAFGNLKAAAPSGTTLVPIPSEPTPPKPTPTPPVPTPEHKHTKGLKMEIDGKIVQLRGTGGMLVTPDEPNTGTWGSLGNGWRGVAYRKDGDPGTRHRATKLPNGSYTFLNVDHNGFAGADGGQYSPALDKQGYYMPDGKTGPGPLEQWHVYDGNDNGAIEAQIEQFTDDKHPAGAGKKFFVFPLTVEIVG